MSAGPVISCPACGGLIADATRALGRAQEAERVAREAQARAEAACRAAAGLLVDLEALGMRARTMTDALLAIPSESPASGEMAIAGVEDEDDITEPAVGDGYIEVRRP